MESVLLVLLAWPALAPVQAQEGDDAEGERAHASVGGEEVQAEALPSEVDLDLLRFGIEQINEAIRVGDTKLAASQVENLARLVAAATGTASRAEIEVLNLLAAHAHRLSALQPLYTIRMRILRGLEAILPEDHTRLLVTRHNLANTMADMGDLSGAHALQQAVLEAYERTLPEGHPRLVRTRSNLANVKARMGDLAAARTLQEAVLEAYEKALPEDHTDLLRTRHNLATVLWEMGDLPGARALYEVVLEARERTLPRGHLDILGTRNNLAGTMQQMGDLVGARALIESVVDDYARTVPPDHVDALRTRSNLASLILKMGDLLGARALQEAVLEIQEGILPEHDLDLLRTRSRLANTMLEAGDPASARALLETVHESRVRTLPRDHPDLLQTRHDLALVMTGMDDLPGARALVPPLVSGMREYVLASLALAPRQAREAVASVTYVLVLVQFLTRSAGPAHQVPAFEVLETMRAVAAEAARAVRCSADPEIEGLTKRAGSVRSKLNDLVLSPVWTEGNPEEFASTLTRLTAARDRLEREASTRLAKLGMVMQPIEAELLAEKLPAGAAVVGYRRMARLHRKGGTRKVLAGEDYLLAHVLRSDGSLTRVDLGAAAELEELVVSWRRTLGRPISGRGVSVRDVAREATVGAAGEALRERLLDPIVDVLSDETTTLHVGADDLVFLVPLDALPLRDGYVGDRYTVCNEVSFARLQSGREEPAKSERSMLLLGGIAYGSSDPGERPSAAKDLARSGIHGFAPLDGARVEVEALQRLFHQSFDAEAVLLTDDKATKDAIARHAAGKRYLHLATHGWFAPESIKSQLDDQPNDRGWASMGLEERVTGMAPMLLCGLALAGANQGRDSLGRMLGLLTAEELCSLDLSACELAVLSACETNVGIRRAGQGIQSLQAALYAAGARSSITSLWKVDDAQTRRLMELFYMNLWEKKIGKAEALWEAKRALREEGAPVRDWGGWVLTGDPR